jgi:VWFA-related protein
MSMTAPGKPLAFALVIGVLIAGRAVPGAAVQQRFAAEATSIRLHLTAIDSKGQPVTDLAQSELHLTVGNEPREIRVLRWLGEGRRELVAADKSASPAAMNLPLPFASNRGEAESHTWFIVVNHGSLRPGDERQVMRMLDELVTRLPARDRVGVATIPQGRALVEFTTDRPAVLKALGQISGYRAATAAPAAGAQPQARWANFGSVASCAEARTRVVLDDLAAMLQVTADSPGPKTLVLVSGEVPPLADPQCSRERERLIRAAESSGAFLVAIEPYQFATDAMIRGVDAWSGFDSVSVSSASQNLADVAAATGGDLYRVSGSGAGLRDRLERMPEARYELYFDARTDERTGKLRDLRVTTTRAGVEILARQHFTASEAKGAAASPTADQLMAGGTLLMDVPIRLAAYPFRNGRSKDVKVMIVAESDVGASPLAEVRFGLLDAKRKIVSGWQETPPGSGPIVTAASITPGRYHARAVMMTADGRSGSAEFEFMTALAECRGAALSGIMVGAVVNGAFKPALRVGDTADAYLEVYTTASGGQSPVVTFSVDGQQPIPAQVTATRDPDRWIVNAPLPSTLASGDHGLVATVLDGAREICRTTSAFRKAGAGRP